MVDLDHDTNKLSQLLPGSGWLILDVAYFVPDVLVIWVPLSDRLQLVGKPPLVQVRSLSSPETDGGVQQWLSTPEDCVGNIDIDGYTGTWTALAETDGLVDTLLGFDVESGALESSFFWVLAREPGTLGLVHGDGWGPGVR